MPSALELYGGSLSLLTDLYELTMACGYWKSGIAERESVFHLSFRRHPFGGRFTVAAGLATAVQFLRDFRFEADDVDYLRGLKDAAGQPLLEEGFLEYLARLELSCDVHAAPEGSIVNPHEPLVRVQGPLAQCQLLETALLNILNFQTLIATKAARIVQAAGGDSVLEFGARRAQGIDGAVSASRAAYVGGCSATSNVLAGKLYGIPVRGTHAHSWVMSFDSEADAFEAWARVMPNNAIFLVDTYETIEGVRHAIEAGQRLADRGHRVLGIRLDSGDLAALSAEARRMLDAAGLEHAKIVASGDLEEESINELKAAGAPIAVWGVGTNLVTGKGDPALSGVYKLSAIRGEDGSWDDRVKLSETADKSSLPGIQQVRRFRDGERPVRDVIYDERLGIAEEGGTDLLVPVFRKGACLFEPEDLRTVRERAAAQLAAAGDKECPVEIEPRLAELGRSLRSDAKRNPG